MRVWHFSEQPYPDAWTEKSLRVNVPSRLYDPEKGADLLNRYLDEWMLCDELGLDIMVNEHHCTATCISPSCTLPLAILARQTQKSRLLSLGIPIANRSDPVRVAEEVALIDVISRGRFEMGLVKGAPYEISPANSNPVRQMDRFWEAHDLIIKAITTHDGPFNWEGRYYHYRCVNVWPRPYQQPTPPIWITASSEGTGRAVADKRYVVATVLSGFNARRVYGGYRARAREMGWTPTPDRFGYLGLVGVGQTREEGYRRAETIVGYLRTQGLVSEVFKTPPGYNPAAAVADAIRSGRQKSGFLTTFHVATPDGRRINPANASIEDLIAAGVVFAGTPDDVFDQIRTFNDDVGGLGHLCIMAQGGTLSHEETVANLKLFSREVLPRLQTLELSPEAADRLSA